jgi:hypothetical protein
MVTKKRISPENILLVILFGYASLRSMRNIPLFIIIAIPVLSNQICSLVKILPAKRPPTRKSEYITPILLGGMVLISTFQFIQVTKRQASIEADEFPKAAVDWIISNKPRGNLFNSYQWGGYLIWMLYPEYQVYIDGRADVYGDAFIFDYISITHTNTGWEKKLDQQEVRAILIEPETQLANILRNSPKWQIGYEDQTSILFIR